MTKWGVVATVKAAHTDVLNFAAHHLDLGAHRLYVYLDGPAPETYATLKAHPKIRVTACDAVFWQKNGGWRPKKHQVRQIRNATHAYQRRTEVDWFAHIDVDEFLWPAAPIADLLKALPPDVQCARTYPIELLAGSNDAYKGRIPDNANRAAIAAELYPTFGEYLKGGFLSHVAGKLFYRTGITDLDVRIHNIFQGETMNPGETLLPQIELCHHHATSWDNWRSAYRYRLRKGAYRADLSPAHRNTMTLHGLLSALEADDKQDALRDFFDEVAADSPDLRARLDAHGLLRICNLGLDTKRLAHFPDV
ncbi:MAG: glycosyltransferase family 2 protein [Paracoccaceae bacterium]